MSTQPTGIPPEVVTAMGAPPTDEQWAAISMPLKPYVLVAGAGRARPASCRARVFLALAALDRIQVADDPGDDAGVLPGNVLCLTFTVKATENLRSRVRRALAGIELPEGEEPEILNYHAMAAQVLERHGILAGIEAGRRVLSQAQRVELAGRVLDEMEFVHTKTEWQPSVVDKTLNLDSQIGTICSTPTRSLRSSRNASRSTRRSRAPTACTPRRSSASSWPSIGHLPAAEARVGRDRLQ